MVGGGRLHGLSGSLVMTEMGPLTNWFAARDATGSNTGGALACTALAPLVEQLPLLDVVIVLLMIGRARETRCMASRVLR